MSVFASLHEAQSFLEHNPDIELFELFILDNNGVPRGKLLHRDELLAVYESGRPLPSTILGLTINGDDVENSGLVWEVGDIDCRAYPISGSLQRMPWRLIPTAAVQVSMHPSEGLPATVADPRQVLAKVIDALKADGYYPVMAAELEFYLLDQKPDSHGRPQPALDQDGGRPRATQVYGLRELEQIEPFLADLYSACKLQGIPARTAISEYAPGQVEITLEHRSDALQAMDEAVRYKRLVKGVAHKHGMTACFMAKPFDDLAGTGLHMHVSLADAEGRNLFASAAADGTPLLRHAVGGMLSTLLDSLLMFCPNANSYRRFQANSYAPLAATWGWTIAPSACAYPVGRRPRGISNTASAAPTPTRTWPPPRSWPASIAAFASSATPALRWKATVTPRPKSGCPPTGSPPCAHWKGRIGRGKRSGLSFSACTWRSSAPNTASSWGKSVNRIGAGICIKHDGINGSVFDLFSRCRR